MAIFNSNDKIISPAQDFVFKAIMMRADAKPALNDLISAVIKRTVINTQLRNNELPAGGKDEKNERFDVSCEINDGSLVEVEIQKSKTGIVNNERIELINRCIYYLTDLHSSQKAKSNKYEDLVRTYQITFCNYEIFDKTDYLTEASMRTEDGSQISDQINISIIELNKLKKIIIKPIENMTPLDMWSIFIKYADHKRKRDLINKLMETREAINVAGTILTELSNDEDFKAKLRAQRKFENDYNNDVAKAEERGIKKSERKWQAIVEKKDAKHAIEITAKDREIASKDTQHAAELENKDREIANKDTQHAAELENKDREIAELRRLLEESKQ